MKFEQGKNNLRDIHKFMTSIEQLHAEMTDDAKSISKNKVKNHIVKTFNFHSSKVNTNNRLSSIENNLNKLRVEIEGYKQNLLLSKIYMLEFKEATGQFFK